MSAVALVPAAPCPVLSYDERMAAEFNKVVSLRGRVERAVAWNLMLHLAANGWEPTHVDGDHTDTALEAMDIIFDLDDCHINFRKGTREHSVLLVCGNDGTDLVSDWQYSRDDEDGFNAVMEAFDGEAVVASLLGGAK